MKRSGLVALAVGVLACSGEPLSPMAPGGATTTGSASASASAAPAPVPPAFRLTGDVAPKKIAATLTVVPSEDTFRGEVAIDLRVSAATRVIWLHAKALEVATAQLEVNGEKRVAKVIPGGEELLGFVFEREVPVGEARLTASYTGRISSSEDHGVFREKEGSDVYLYSQFEATDARRAIPCFDEPSFKIPWQITLRVKAGEVALSNTPVLAEETSADGWKTVRFAETKPLPSYLVAFAVGPFELVDAGKAGKNGTPIRFAVPRGHVAEAGYAVASAGKIVDLLEQEFQIPYPYEKLDFVTIPHVASFGAMENAGMITVGARYVLAKPADQTEPWKHNAAAFIGHEVAHQWFGNLVTMAWWDDIWLNEGFATWMEERKITPRFGPAFGAEQHALSSVSRVMSQDGLLSTRKVRQEVLSADDIENAFDGITYSKGGAVLAMFEGFLGAPAFQKGVRLYLDRFAFKNATSNDFLAALGEGAGRDVKVAVSTFLDQPGVPIVTTSLVCGASSAKLELSQERFLPFGSKGEPAAQTWQIPVCARYGSGKQAGSVCGLLAAKKGELLLPALPGKKKGDCPEWVMPKEGGLGYYRVAYTPATVGALLDKGKAALTAGERMNVVHDLRALTQNARFPVGEALSRLPSLLEDPSGHVQAAGVGLLGLLRDDFVEAALRPNVKRFVSNTIAPRARALGWQGRAGESAEARTVREDLLYFMVEVGDDPKLFAAADALADGWLAGTTTIEPDAVGGVLSAATSRGDRRLFDRITAALAVEKDKRRREHLVAALAGFRDPALARAGLDLYLAGGIDAREGMSLFWNQPRGNRAVVWAFVKERFDALMARVPEGARTDILSLPGAFCDEASRADVESFLKDRAAKVPGAPRVVAQAVESIALCVARREAYKESLGAFLKKQ